MSGDPFTSSIFRWLNRVAADSALPPAAFKLAYVISQHINRQSHTAWPSQKTLKLAIGVKAERTVGRLCEALEAGGHLLTTQRKQTSLIYRLAQDRTELSYLEDPEPAAPNEPRPDENVWPCDQDRTFLTARPDNFDAKAGQECPPNHLNNHLRNHEGESARPTLLPNDFKLDDQTYNLALERLGSTAAVDRSVARFVDHHRQVTGKQATSRDWQAKARLWIDDDANKVNPDKSAHTAAKRLADRVASFSALSVPTEAEWRSVLISFQRLGRWTMHVSQFGPPPLSPGCLVPEYLLTEYGIKKEAAA